MTNNYSIYFEVYGHKLKTVIQATSEAEAKRKVISKIKFNKVVCNEVKETDVSVEFLKNMFGIK